MRTSPFPTQAGAALLVLTLAFTLVLAGCERQPTEAERKARDAAVAAAVQKAQDEDRARDRELQARARADAARMMPADTPGDAAGEPQDSVARAAANAAADDKSMAPFLARARRLLVDPESMLTQSPRLREMATVLCVDINAKNRAGTYVGYVPTIITGDAVYFYLEARDAVDPREPIDVAAFVKQNERLRCWSAETPKAAEPPKAAEAPKG